MKSPRHHHSRWSHCNTPEALRRRRAAADARRQDRAESLPPVYVGPDPLSAWQTVQVLDAAGSVLHSLALYVPTSGRCDQHAAEIDGAQADALVTATDIGRLVARWIVKRPSATMIDCVRRESA